MPSAHAKLGPSSSSRWLTCTASITMSEKVPRQPESPYAAEGTMAHELGELKAGHEFGLITPHEFRHRSTEWYERFEELYPGDLDRLADMEEHTDAYVEVIRERLARVPGSELLLEQRVDTGVAKCWGTSDVVIVSMEHVEIIDLKYGMGVPVDAYENTQLMLYGVGALDTFGDVLGYPHMVYMTVFQPRTGSGQPSTYELTPIELRHWRDTVAKPAAEEALGDNPKFAPSDKACRWCPAAGYCKPRMEQMMKEDFGADPDLITPEELAELIPKLPGIKAFCSAVETAALDRAYTQGEDIPGFKVVNSGGKRYVADDTAAIQAFIDAGIPAEKTTTFKVKGIGELEKAVRSATGLKGKKVTAELERILGDNLCKSTGTPSLVPEADKREAISPTASAVADFTEADDE